MGYINENIVLNFYIEEMDKDDIQFLKGRNTYKTKIRQYIENLKDQEDMHDKIQITKGLWKVLFEAAMSYIDDDKRGYDVLFNYFNEYINFEELIFASDSFYRDHTLHCLWVYFLEEYIVKHEDFNCITQDINKDFKDVLKMASMFKGSCLEFMVSDFIQLTDSIAKTLRFDDSIRCISALTHDLGYPLKKISKINKCIKNILPYFSINNYNEFNFHFSEVQQNFIDDFLNFLCIGFRLGINGNIDDEKYEERLKKLFIKDDVGNMVSISKETEVPFTDKEKKQLKKFIKSTAYTTKDLAQSLRYKNDFEEYKHGIMSSFLLTKTIQAFKNVNLTIENVNELSLSEINLSDVMAKQSILRTIADHTSDSYQITSIQGHSEFLILIDELEEFSRISRANQNRQYVNEFCKTDIYTKDGCLQVDFIFDNTHIDNLDPERAFKDKCRRFLTLFKISKLSENLKLKIRYIGQLPYNKRTYMLEIARKCVSITIDGIEQNIPEYLSSSQFYTKEEYLNM